MIDHTESKFESIIGLILRIYWMMAGGFISLLAAVVAAVNHSETSRLPTIIFWSNSLGLVIARYLDIRYFNGLTADGESATLKDWKRYSLWVVAASIAVWLAAQFVGNFRGA